MPELVLPILDRDSQPQSPIPINPEFNRAGNTVLWVPPFYKTEVARGALGTINGEATYGVTYGSNLDGVVMLPDISHSRNISWPVTTNVARWTMAIRFQAITNTEPYLGVAEYSDGIISSTPRVMLQIRSSGDIYVRDGTSSLIIDTGGAAQFVGLPGTAIMRWDGTTLHYYRLGKHLSYTGALNNSASAIRFGSGSPGCANVALSLGYWVEDDIGHENCLALIDNPWELFEPDELHIHWAAAAGGAFKPAWIRQPNAIIGGR